MTKHCNGCGEPLAALQPRWIISGDEFCTDCYARRAAIEGGRKVPQGMGLKDDGEKLPIDLLPMRALQEVAKVMAFGARKYDRNSWQGVKPRRRYFAALMRHLFDRALGKRIDEESGLPVMAHAACDALFLLAFDVGLDPIDAFDEKEAT